MGDEESGIVGSVVHHLEGGYLEGSYLESEFLVDRGVIVLDASRHIVTAQDTVEGAQGAVELHVTVATQYLIGLGYVVVMVVGEDDAFHILHSYAVGVQGGHHLR